MNLLDLDNLALSKVLEYAAHQNYMAYVLQFVCKRVRQLTQSPIGFLVSALIYEHPARDGRLSLVQWLRGQKIKWDETVLEWAAIGGRLGVIKWATGQGGLPLSQRIYNGAAFGGHLYIIEWLYAKGVPLDRDLALDLNRSASRGGHLDVLKWLRGKNALWCTQACTVALYEGQLEVLKWLRSVSAPYPPWPYGAAASNGHLKILKWLKAEGALLDDQCCAWAAGNGHLECLIWLMKNGAPFNHDLVLGQAEIGGHARIVAWLKS